MALPKEPRQKMINMMYLVLTAMLALNVSSEIINAFRTVNQSLMNANETIDLKNDQIFASFEQKIKSGESLEKAMLWQGKAMRAKKLSDDMIKYIDSLKVALILEVSPKRDKNLPTDSMTSKEEDNLEASTRLMIEKKAGAQLKERLETYKQDLLKIDPLVGAEFAKTLPIDLRMPKVRDRSNYKWEYAYFHMTPTIAATTILSKFQNDIKNSEAMVVDFCHRQVGQVQFVYDQFQAFAGTNATYLMPGQELVITAGVGAFSKAAQPTVTIDGRGIPLNANGVAESKFNVQTQGNHVAKVVVSYTTPDGQKASISKDVSYFVGSPTGITVSAESVKVLYVGLDNELAISGGSKGAESFSASISQGSLENKGGGRYIAHVTTAGNATVTVNSEGKSSSFNFRVRSVPPPVPKVGNSGGGAMSVNEFKAQRGLRADLENFVFEGVKFEVVRFKMIFNGKGFEDGIELSDNSGAYFNGTSRSLMERCKPGSNVSFDDIYVKGPGGETRKLTTSISFNMRP